MRAAKPGPNARLLAPPLVALATLDAALMAARAALLIAEHPDTGPRGGLHAAQPAAAPPLLPIAARVIERIAELRHWLTRYRRALDADHGDHDRRQAELPF